MPVVVALLNS
jgi:NAD(P) transhydrogenase subunit beta